MGSVTPRDIGLTAAGVCPIVSGTNRRRLNGRRVSHQVHHVFLWWDKDFKLDQVPAKMLARELERSRQARREYRNLEPESTSASATNSGTGV